MDTDLQTDRQKAINICLLYAQQDEETARQIVVRWRLLQTNQTIHLYSLLHLQPGEPYNLLDEYAKKADVLLLLLSPDTEIEDIMFSLQNKTQKFFVVYLRPVLEDILTLLRTAKITRLPTKPISYYADRERALAYVEKHFFRWLYNKQPQFRKRTQSKVLLLKMFQKT